MDFMDFLVVLTGGPCAGKSTILDRIVGFFGEKVGLLSERATRLFEVGFPAPNPWSLEWQDRLQEAIFWSQVTGEADAIASAVRQGVKVVVCDRGLLDGAAYLAGGVSEFCGRFGISEAEALNRYQVVIHLESLATLNPKLHLELMSSNPHRFEAPDRARELEMAHLDVWSHHPNRHHLSGDLEANASRVIEIIQGLL